MTSESSVAGHTLGPWVYDGFGEIAEVARPYMRVCSLPSDHAEYASSKPNGYLIAAAPESLAALRNITECADAGADGANMDLWISQARAAIAKATGGAL